MALRFADLVLTDPVCKQVIWVLAAAGDAKRDPGEIARQRSRKGALRVQREDDRRLEPFFAQLLDAGEILAGASIGRSFHPWSGVLDNGINFGHEASCLRTGLRGQDSYGSARCRLLERAEGRRGHQQVAHAVQTDRKDAPGLSPAGDSFGRHGRSPRVRPLVPAMASRGARSRWARAISSVVDRPGTYPAMTTSPPNASTIAVSRRVSRW